MVGTEPDSYVSSTGWWLASRLHEKLTGRTLLCKSGRLQAWQYPVLAQTAPARRKQLRLHSWLQFTVAR